MLLPLGVDEPDLHGDRWSSSAAKKDAADFRIWFARRNSRFSRSSSAILAASDDVVPDLAPASVSACFTQVRDASGCTPSWSAIRLIAPLFEAGSRLASNRVARSRKLVRVLPWCRHDSESSGCLMSPSNPGRDTTRMKRGPGAAQPATTIL